MPPEGVNKYEVVRELTSARHSLKITDRALAVLQALLSFHKSTILGGNSDELVVYPSNAAICERMNGIPCSTMRRHLTTLVDAGLIIRRDSPNGKRFVRRYGDDAQTFGFDVTPLVQRFAEICEIAEATRAQEEQEQRLRRTVSLMRRDLAGLAAYGQEARPQTSLWIDFQTFAAHTAKQLRRKLTWSELKLLEVTLLAALNTARDAFDLGEAETMSTNGADFEQHHQNSNKDSYDSEPTLEQSKEADSVPKSQPAPKDANLPNIPLGLVLSACSEVATYAPDKIRHWHELVRAAEVVRPMMGISRSAWDDAITAMGAEQASVVVIAMLERFGEIKSPGGYLRSLTSKAEQGAFSCGPMIMALLHKEAA